MIALTGEVVVMPTWVFLFLLALLIGINALLMWCNHEQAHDLRHERRRRVVHDHLHHDGPAPTQLLITGDLEWTDEMTDRAITRIHNERGGQ